MLDRTRDVADQARRIAGAVGYMTKAVTGDEIGRAVHAAAAGQTVMDLAVQRKLLAAARRAPGSVTPPDVGLTVREAEVLALIGAGRTNREIARELHVTEATVKTHVNRVFAKTGCDTRARAVRYAHDHGYTAPADRVPGRQIPWYVGRSRRLRRVRRHVRPHRSRQTSRTRRPQRDSRTLGSSLALQARIRAEVLMRSAWREGSDPASMAGFHVACQTTVVVRRVDRFGSVRRPRAFPPG